MPQKIYAHRGASGYAPENTLRAFALAADMGADGVELDVHLTLDDELVVAHDETIDRCSNGTGLIREKTLRELKGYRFHNGLPQFKNAAIPTLGEVFELLRPTGLLINIELKNSLIDYPGLEQKCIDLAAREGILSRILFSSFNHHSLKKIKAIDPGLYCGLLYECTMIKPWVYAVALEMDALHPHYSEVLIPGGECAAAHKAGIDVNPWTVNGEDDLRAVISAGADGIITNYPDRALALLTDHGHQ